YLTAAVNEGFLDTAQLRESVAAHARMLGYQMRGMTSARQTVNVAVQLENTSAGSTTLPKNTPFVLASNSQFVFYNPSDVTLTKNTSSTFYEATGVTVVEGQPLQYRFTADTNDPTQRFIIPNENIDYSTITVKVQASESSNVITQFVRDSN